MNIKGEISRIRRFDDGYTILTILPDKIDDLITANEWGVTLVGNMPPFIEGMIIDAKVEEIEHPKYGTQYKVHEIIQSGFNTTDAIIDYLSSSCFKGIGKVLARKIVDKLGLKTLDILDDNPEIVKEIKGINSEQFIQQWQENRASHRSMAKLMSLGLTMNLAAKAFNYFGIETIAIIEENPYSLIEIPGVGFHKADEIALKMGVLRSSSNRIKSAISYTLDNIMWSMGHCFLMINQLLGEITKLLNNDVNHDNIINAIKEMEKEFIVIVENNKIYLSNIYYAEKNIAEHIKEMLQESDCTLYEDNKTFRSAIKNTMNMELDPEQENAILMALNSRICVITGNPGTGKSYCTKTICDLFDNNNIEYELCSPTGRAAKRLSEATEKEARTIHRLLGYQNGEFIHNSSQRLQTNCVLVDEVSMVDILLFRHLLDAMETDTRLILVGDADQLPSVGPGNVLHDLINSGIIPVVRLKKIFRQEKGSSIISAAHDILNGKVPDITTPAKSNGKNCMFVGSSDHNTLIEHVLAMATKHIPKAGYKIEDIQVLTPMRERGLGINDLNPRLQAVLNPPSIDKAEVHIGFSVFRVGDRVLHIRNDYKKEVFNGEVGFIAGINKEESSPIIYVRYPDKDNLVEYTSADWNDIQHAFASTIHRSQGSEYPVVIVILHSSQHIMLQRNLFYTALTRAKKLCVIAGTQEAMEIAVANNKIQKRNTTLKERLVS